MSQSKQVFNARLWKWRSFQDQSARVWIAVGGVGIIAAILLIFFYLLYVVFPIFKSAEIHKIADYSLSDTQTQTLYLSMEEQGTMAARYQSDGQIVFFYTKDGAEVERFQLPLDGEKITAISKPMPGQHLVALGTESGKMLVVKHKYRVTYPNDKRHLTPALEFPFGEELIAVDSDGQPLKSLSFYQEEDRAGVLGYTQDQRLVLATWDVEEDIIEETLILEADAATSIAAQNVTQVLLSPDFRHAFTTTKTGEAWYYRIEDGELVETQTVRVTESGADVTRFQWLLGGSSIMVTDVQGDISQWFLVRDTDGNLQLQKIRGFETENKNPISALVGEHRRKGFIAANEQGEVGIYYTTSHRTLLEEKLVDASVVGLSLSARGEHLLIEDVNGKLHLIGIENEHPEISWAALWQEVWYEGYQEPEFTWQSSAATSDFESKFSLVPLTFGTMKAAFYAMLFAMPLALMGAIFTAQFMTARMRVLVKPTIEIMEALPTVILGFLAGLWLAPYLEDHLPGIFSMLLLVPTGILMVAYLFFQLPLHMRNRMEGWEALALVPVVIFFGWLALELSQPLENILFAGNMQLWMLEQTGISYDQRNSLIIGLTMGFAVIPTIFSIAEDAIFSVPQHLIRGSMALGATRWQTLVNVVLPTASPAIFSALMMGLGRAVGETMIVLMATGNTPILDMSIFEGMRTLSANIAVEMPESEVGSSHYRVLFLSALVLFAFTFVINTGAEIVRQRLRKKYASL